MTILNLFISVIIQAYQEISRLEYGRISNRDLENFKRNWKQFDKKGIGLIWIKQFTKLLEVCDPPLGYEIDDMDEKGVKMRFLYSLNIPVYQIGTKGPSN